MGWFLDLCQHFERLVWRRLEIVPELDLNRPRPLQRCHCAANLGNKLVFFGGGPPGLTTNNLVVLDTESGVMRNISQVCGRLPSKRQNSVCGILPGTGIMVVYGGALATSGYEELGDTYMVDFDFTARTIAGARGGEEFNPNEAHRSNKLYVIFAIGLSFFAAALHVSVNGNNSRTLHIIHRLSRFCRNSVFY